MESRRNFARCLMNGTRITLHIWTNLIYYCWNFFPKKSFCFLNVSLCVSFNIYRAAHIKRKCGNKQLSSSIYLSEAEPFLEQYAKRSPKNQVLVGSAGNLVRAEDFLALVDGDLDEEGDLMKKEEVTPATPEPAVKEAVQKAEGLIVFFPGIPGCAKSALCKELLNAPGGLGDDRPVHTLMGDLVKGISQFGIFSKVFWLSVLLMPTHDCIFYILHRKILAKGC